jgi:hypothetical protein
LNHRRIVRLVCLLFALIFNALVAKAQLTRGFVSGTVTDGSGPVLAGVEVTITNTATNISRTTTTNDLGFFRFAAVEPGEYSAKFNLTGFDTFRIDQITVNTAQEVTVNQTLTLSRVSSEISVTEVPGIDLAKTSATIERTFPGRLVEDFPLTTDKRDVTRLSLLAPNVSRAPASNQFSANGQRARNNNFMLDGIDNNDFTVTLDSARTLPEAVAEVQVQTLAYSAEFGHSSGAQFSVITKGGTNQFHGAGWEFYQGNWMQPVSLTSKRAGINTTPRFDVNEFGADVGGPIIENRTFFFGLAEWNRRREAPIAANAAPANIPTPAGYAALQRIPLAAGQAPASRQAVFAALSFLPQIYPQITNYENVSNVVINDVPVEVGTIRIPIANPLNYFYSAARIDHKLTNNDDLMYRYHIDHRDQPNVTSNLQFGTKWSASQSILRQNHAVSYTHIFSPRFLNEARLAYVRGNLQFPENDAVSPTVNIANFFFIGGLNVFPQGRLDHIWQYQDVASYFTGRHAIKFGMDLRRYWLFSRQGTDSKGTWVFGSLADFINNQATTLTQSINEASFVATEWDHAYFFQDDFKAAKNLTLNLGLRYQYSTAPLGLFGATDPVIQAAGVPGPAKPDKSNWAPRIGFAYTPASSRLFGNGETVVRGGFGIAYDVIYYNVLLNEANNYPRVLNSITARPATINLFPTLTPKTSVTQPFNPAAVAFVNSPVNTKHPATNFWSLSVQRQFGSNYLVEVGYTGNRSYHQIRQGQANPPVLTADQAATVIARQDPNIIAGIQARRVNPNWSSRTLLESSAKASYEAGYVKFDRRLTRNIMIGANYTFSGTWSDNDEPFGIAPLTDSSPQLPEDFFNYRKEWSRSVFDRPHRFAVTYFYELPWFSSGWAAGSLAKIFTGWQISGFVDAQSGQPFTIRTGVDSTGVGDPRPARPNYSANGIFKPNYDSAGVMKQDYSGGLRTFYIPVDGTGIVTAPLGPNGILANSMPGGGNLGRNTFRGPGFQNWNFSLLKSIAIRESMQFQIRSDFTNLWNHRNFPNPVAVMSSTSFGQNTAALLSDARLILFSAKLKF